MTENIYQKVGSVILNYDNFYLIEFIQVLKKLGEKKEQIYTHEEQEEQEEASLSPIKRQISMAT